MGPGIRLTVNTGDRIKMAVQARSINPSEPIPNLMIGSLVGIVTAGFGIVPGEAAYTGFNSNLDGLAGTITTSSSSSPKAYLNYILFNSSYTGEPLFGYVPVPDNASTSFKKLEMDIPIPAGYANGYMYIYTNNESNYNVYFDEVCILHEKTNSALQVTQLSDYYPFGLGFNVWNKESIKANRYLYQKQELQDDLGYDEYQYKYRMHDPAMGRFLSVDPLSEKYMYNSTYAFSENRVIDGIELEGLEFQGLYGQWASTYGGYVNKYRNDFDGGYIYGAYDMAFQGGKSLYNGFKNSLIDPYALIKQGYEGKIKNQIEFSDQDYRAAVGSTLANTRYAVNSTVADAQMITGVVQHAGNTLSAQNLVTGFVPGGLANIAPKLGPGGRNFVFGNDAATVATAMNVRMLPARNIDNLVVHGASEGFIINNSPISAKEVSIMMFNNGYKAGTPVRCISCYTGLNDGGAAYQLSRYLRAPVIAPTDLISVNDFGTKIYFGGYFNYFNFK
jgi:RHS repeat-associated protein